MSDRVPTDRPRIRTALPAWIRYGAVLAVVLSWLPLVWVAHARIGRSGKPRIHLIQDMDAQPKLKAQAYGDQWADHRAMRGAVVGTIARGRLTEDDHYYRGWTTDASNAEPTKQWAGGLPAQVKLDEALLRRGQERFNVFCAPCHGSSGDGEGTVPLRTRKLGAPWVVLSLHTDNIRKQPLGELFNTITWGKKSMPPYAQQIPPVDRWAIVAYIKALQLSQNATMDDVPPQVRKELIEPMWDNEGD